jgi:hypothetical protein
LLLLATKSSRKNVPFPSDRTDSHNESPLCITLAMIATSHCLTHDTFRSGKRLVLDRTDLDDDDDDDDDRQCGAVTFVRITFCKNKDFLNHHPFVS